MPRRLLSLALSAALVFSAFPQAAFAQRLSAPADLDAYFDGAARRGPLRGAPAVQAGPSARPMAPAAAPDASARRVTEPPAPSGELKRESCSGDLSLRERVGCFARRLGASVKEGVAIGSLMYTATLLATAVAGALGYQFHPNYGGGQAAVIGPVAAALTTGVIAPLWEEFVFRHLAFGKLAEKFGKHLGPTIPYLVATILDTAVFVLLHETADPVMIAVRAMGNLMLLHAYKREGLAASTLAHAVYNLSLVAPALLVALGILPATPALLAVAGVNALIAAIKGTALFKELAASVRERLAAHRRRS